MQVMFFPIFLFLENPFLEAVLKVPVVTRTAPYIPQTWGTVNENWPQNIALVGIPERGVGGK